jgi:hypothetical protein
MPQTFFALVIFQAGLTFLAGGSVDNNLSIYASCVAGIVAGTMSDQREQDSNPGGCRKGRFIMLAGQHLDLSPKMALALQLKSVGFLSLRMWKQASRKDKSRRGS